MRFERLIARAFGRLVGEELEFAKGMTVVSGPNEAGKSTWHDALYVGLCGMRRAKGAPSKEDRELKESRRPWRGDGFAVTARIVLEDGRPIELNHDLDRLEQCRATDLTLGRDVSSEILDEGTPDGARWLGLDRKTFPATACVRQTELLAVLEGADQLQDCLQRAAASGGRDETVAAALERIHTYRSEHVGANQKNSTKPLRRAFASVEGEDAALKEARQRHEAFLELCAREEAARGRAGLGGERRGKLQSERSRREAARWVHRAGRARALAVRFPDGPPPPLDEGQELAQAVARALGAWSQQPSPPPVLTPPTADDLRRELAALPSVTAGDREPAPEVGDAAAEREDKKKAVDHHLRNRPALPGERPAADVEPEVLRELARELEEPEPPAISLDDRERLEALRHQLDRPRSRDVGLWVGGVLVLAGLAGFAVVEGLRAVTLAITAFGIGILAWTAMQSGRRLRTAEDLRELEGRVGEADLAARQYAGRRSRAEGRASELGVPPNSAVLWELADRLRDWLEVTRREIQWQEQHTNLAQAVGAAERALRDALVSRSVAVVEGAELSAVVHAYRRGCADRARIAAEAGRRPALEQALAARAAAENFVAEQQRIRDGAERQLREAARQVGITGEDADALARDLTTWQQRHNAERASREGALGGWAELQGLLDGMSLAEIEAEATRRALEVEGLPGAEEAIQALSDSELPPALQEAERDLGKLREESARLGGERAERARDLPSVAEAEERCAAAHEELARVQRLGRVLERTTEHLEAAQERVHRDIAPRLAESVRRSLAQVTGGRYVDATVDPATLEVRVKERDGDWRQASTLSHGTREQIYLLLRLALAEHLTQRGEVCPLLLDDVTTQCDAMRTEAILGLLHEASRDRQIVLFTQQEQVLAWAREHLGSSRDRVVELGTSTTPTTDQEDLHHEGPGGA